jgi:predicted flap endonuclease-1-like 5' DNA nuclease
MAYLIEQIFWYLLAGFVLGVVIGWIAGASGAKKKIAELESKLAEMNAQAESKSRGTPVEKIEGIGTGFGQRLREDGIDTTEKLLEACTTSEGVSRICECVDLDEDTVRNWGAMADLMRINGLGGQWAELMWRAGVMSVQDLASEEVAPLRARFREVNEREHRVAELPGENRVTKFIEQAKELEAVLPDGGPS